MKQLKKGWVYTFAAVILSLSIISCEDKDGINGYMPERPIGGYASASEVASENLVAYWSFNGNVNDSVQNLVGTATNTSFATGKKGQALKGATNGFVTYNSAGTALPALQSFTVSLWINTQKHTGGAQSVFMLPRTSDFWGNMFMMIEGNDGPTDSMLVKFHFDGNWVEFTGNNRMPNMYGGWKHVAFSYNANTSKFAAYVNGSKLTLPASMSDRKNGTAPLGPLQFNDVSKFIIGGFQQHLGSPWSAPDGWMLPYTGQLDEFRIYNKALEDSDVNALYKLEALGR